MFFVGRIPKILTAEMERDFRKLLAGKYLIRGEHMPEVMNALRRDCWEQDDGFDRTVDMVMAVRR